MAAPEPGPGVVPNASNAQGSPSLLGATQVLLRRHYPILRLAAPGKVHQSHRLRQSRNQGRELETRLHC